MATQVSETKLASEVIELSADMLSRLALGESFTTVASAMSVLIGDDPNPGDMLIGVAQLSGSVVTQQIQGGIVGNIYKLALSARTDVNNIYINEIKLAILPDDAAIPA